jgi:hypothetical protein
MWSRCCTAAYGLSTLTVVYNKISLCIYNGRYDKQCLLFFFHRNYNHNYNEIYTHHEYILYKLRLFFHKVSSVINTLFSTFASDAVCWVCRTLCWSVRSLHARCVSACFHSQNSILGVHLSGSQTDGNWTVLNPDCRLQSRFSTLWHF